MSTMAGKTVLITGAARGIGAALAQRVHLRGANVALVGLEHELLARNAHQLGGRAAAFEVDVTDLDSLCEVAQKVRDRFGAIDVAVANAGIAFAGGLITSPVQHVERTLDVNLTGVWRTDRAVAPHLIESRGYLLNVTSLAAVSHMPLMGAYAASKAGAEALTDALRMELRHKGVAVGCAYFGFIDTDLVRGASADPVGHAVLRLGPAAMTRPIPVETAVDAIEAAILRRSSRVWAPRFVGPALALRGLLQPLTEQLTRLRSGQLLHALQLAEERAGDVNSQNSLLGLARTGSPTAADSPS